MIGVGGDVQTGKRDPFGITVAQLHTFTKKKKSLNCTFSVTEFYVNYTLIMLKKKQYQFSRLSNTISILISWF